MNLQELEKQTRAIVIDIVERSAIKKVKFLFLACPQARFQVV
ncbi:Uncharacterised protein [Streptococcus pasteurianus]|nr:Uncharacterised protein [Streptococcus pasteurianus]